MCSDQDPPKVTSKKITRTVLVRICSQYSCIIMMIMSLWPAMTMAQEKCSVDADCMSSQFCNTSSLTCTNDTICRSYNRKESSEPSRAPSTCGSCLEGYSEFRTKSFPAVYGCERDKPQWKILIMLVSSIILISIVIYRAMDLCRTGRTATRGNNPDLAMVEDRIRTASASPTSSLISKMNKREYNDVETNLGLTIGRQVSFSVDIGGPGHARAFHPPDYVRVDDNYDPDNQLTYPLTDIVDKE